MWCKSTILERFSKVATNDTIGCSVLEIHMTFYFSIVGQAVEEERTRKGGRNE